MLIYAHGHGFKYRSFILKAHPERLTSLGADGIKNLFERAQGQRMKCAIITGSRL
jgi:hypothetical protein